MATVTTPYKERQVLLSDITTGQAFSFYIEVPTSLAYFTVQACVHTGSEYVSLSDAIRFDIADFMQGETASFGHTFDLNLPADLTDRFVKNGKRSAQMMLKYVENDKTTEYLPVPNVVMIDRVYMPRIPDFGAERYAFGEVIEDGTDLLVKCMLAFDNVAVKSAPSFEARLYYEQGKEVSNASPYISVVSGVTLNPYILTKRISQADYGVSFTNAQDFTLMLWFGDEFESIYQFGYIFEAFANMHLSGCSTGGVCFGGFSTSEEGEPKFECHYPAYFYGGIITGALKDYSTDEIDTDMKWIDGKKIYRKAVEIGKVGNSASVDTAINTGPMSSIISVGGIGYTAAGVIRPLPFVNPNNTTDNASLTVRNYASSPEIRINTGSSGALASALVIVEYTKPDPTGSENWLGYGKAGSMILG